MPLNWLRNKLTRQGRSIPARPGGRKPARPYRPRVETLEVRCVPSTFSVTNLNDSGAGSFRQAIIDANAASGLDTIDFNIFGSGVRTLTPNTPLPDITDAVNIDATTQPGWAAGSPMVELNGSSAGSSANGLHITGGVGSTVRGLIIDRFGNDGIRVEPPSGNLNANYALGTFTIAGNFIGINATGTAAAPNGGNGITLIAPNNTVGGPSAADRNVISGNTGHGVFLFADAITGGARSNLVEGNYIGVDATGTAAVGNGGDGVIAQAVSGTMIGGITAGQRNIISANKGNAGVVILSDDLKGPQLGNQIQGNYIGTNTAGTAALGNTGNAGLIIQGSTLNVIGGTNAGARNVISGNSKDGILLNGVGSAGTVQTTTLIQGNYIGTNAAGTAAIHNGTSGVDVFASFDNVIGGTSAAAGNVISGNGFPTFGGSGVTISSGGSARNVVEGNYIGTDAAGKTAIPNSESGVLINGVANNTVGGSAAGAGNVISGNGDPTLSPFTKFLSGVTIVGSSATDTSAKQNVVQGNLIGTQADGKTALGNYAQGVYLGAGANNNTIGGVAAGAGNVIAYNGTRAADAGVLIGNDPTIFGGSTAAGIANSVRGNAIYSNKGLGIDLGPADGVTANDLNDPDTGPNNLQNFPVITSAGTSSIGTGLTIVQGTFNSTASTTFNLDFYASDAADPSGNGEGQIYLGSQSVTTNGLGNVAFTANLSAALKLGQVVAATATGPDGTSEFSVAVPVVPLVAISNVTQAEGTSVGTTAFVFTVTLGIASTNTVTVDYGTADGTATAPSDYTPIPASPAQTLTFLPGETSHTITVNVVADSTSEPDETFFVNLTNPTNAALRNNRGTGTIQNDDGLLSIDSVSQNEGNSGPTAFTFTVSLQYATTSTVTVDVTTQDGLGPNAATLADNDYQATPSPQTVTFLPGETSESVVVFVNGDTKYEADETFFVNLTNPSSNATIDPTQGQGTGTIVNDDAAPTLSITSSVSHNEGDTGTTPFDFTVSLSAASYQTITVSVATQDGTATSPSDYTAIPATLVTFNPGDTSKIVTVAVNGDTTSEPDETFYVNLTLPTNAAIAPGKGQGTVKNDDGLLSITPSVSHLEGNSSTTAFTFTVSLQNASALPITVQYTTHDGTATTADNDYVPVTTPQTLTFNPGDITKSATILVNGDTTFETDETFSVILSNPNNAMIAPGQGTGTGTIQNDDTKPTISITPSVSHNEGNSSTTPFTFTVSLSNASYQTITVDYNTADSSATTADSDYVAVSPAQTLTFSPGAALSQQVTVQVNGDTTYEPDETFTVNLSNATNATIAVGQGTGTGTIKNDDAQPAISITPSVSQAEGDTGTTAFTFTVSLSNASYQTITVQYATQDGTGLSGATAPSDYTAVPTTTVTFNPGDTSKQVTVNVNGDTTSEPDETFFVNLSSPSNATIATGQGQGTGTIKNDDGLLSINDVSMNEGNSGPTTFTFTVSLQNASTKTVTVDYSTADGTATTADNDYQAISPAKTLTFVPGDLTKTVDVLVNGDTKYEPDETFSVNLTTESNAAVAKRQGTGTIQNDDLKPTVTIDNPAAVPEGDSGTTPITFTISLSNPSYQTITVQYATQDGTGLSGATAPSDYPAAPATTVTFNPGDTSKQVTVNVNGDTTSEPDETFSVNLSSPSNATLFSKHQGVGTIKNDDGLLSISDVTKKEGNSGPTAFTFLVSLQNASTKQVTVQYTTQDGTASTSSDSDYVPVTSPQTVTFMPGDTSMPVTITVNGDTHYEADETFTVNLSNANNAAIAKGTGTGTILNDDPPPTVLVSDMALPEGNSGTTAFKFAISLSGPSFVTTTVDYSTQDGTASAARSDYIPTSGHLTFAPNTTGPQTITVLVNGDIIIERDETFFVTLSNPGNAIAGAPGRGTILNDDADANLSYVARTYLDLLGRPADPQGLAYWTDQLNHNVPRSALVTTIEATQGYRIKVVNDLFLAILRRPADPNGLALGLSLLANAPLVGGDPVTSNLKAVLYGSQEYFDRIGGGTNSGFLAAVYRDTLGRAPDADGLSHFSGQLNAGVTRQTVALTLLLSTEGEQVEVQSIYHRLLRRDADIGGLDSFVRALRFGARADDIITNLAVSDEYFRQLGD